MLEEIPIDASAMEAERAAEHAEQSSEAANQSAVAATSAAINQAAIIDIVTSAAREDAQRARDQAESAASDAKSQAELTSLIAETAISEIRQMIEDQGRRISALENKKEDNPVSIIGNPPIQELDPGSIEQSERQEDMSGGGDSQDKSRKRSHGRKSRR